MDCAICFEAITKQTGCTTLSCDHSFHFRCIDEWFTKQLLECLNQTCPCCRSEGAELDRCMCEVVEEEEDDEEDEDYEDEPEDDESVSISSEDDEMAEGDMVWVRVSPGRWIVTATTAVAYENLRSLFGPLNEPDFVEDPSVEAARKIQAIYRGYKTRELYKAASGLRALHA